MKIGLIGLGNMGYALMQNWLESGHQVVAWNRSPEPREKARKQTKAIVVDTIPQLVTEVGQAGKRVVFMLIDAGPAVDLVMFGDDGKSGLYSLLSNEDILIDMANSHYTDSQKRAVKLAEKGIKMLDIGISGGIEGAKNGACMMVGGDKEAFQTIEPILKDSAVEDGYGYFGTNGAGHFVKMVHNGIEYGMMQSIAEGVSLIEAKTEFKVDFAKLLNVWNHGSIIESKLIGFLRAGFLEDAKLKNESSEIGDLGTGRWTTEEALKLGVPLSVITTALFNRYQSRNKESFAWKAVSSMRRIFGGHSSQDRIKSK